MYWNEANQSDTAVSDEIVDLVFAIDCRQLPVDHAYTLAAALLHVCPWMADEPLIAIHNVQVAGSQNGWERPEHGTSNYLQVARRTKLRLRAPRTRVPDLLATLPGTRLEVGNCLLTLGVGTVRPLSQDTTLFSRYLVAGPTPDASEHAFLEATVNALAAIDIVVRKALCGKTATLATPQGKILARSLLLANITTAESLRLQQQGLGPHRLLGCGIFIPHKGIDAVNNT